MPEFDDVRRRLSAARDAIARADNELLAVREQLTRITERELALARVSAPDAAGAGSRNERARLARERAAAEHEQERLRRVRGELIGSEGGLAATFATLTDPRRAITSLGDHTPILLMPLAARNALQDVSVPSAPAPTHELWFASTPTTAGSTHSIQRDGGRDSQRSHLLARRVASRQDRGPGAGRLACPGGSTARAALLARRAVPAPESRRSAGEIASRGSHPHDPGRGTGASSGGDCGHRAFWRAAWLANGDASRIATARAALEAAVGAARAAEIITQYQPINFTAQPTNGMQRADLHPSWHLRCFRPLPIRRRTLGRAPRRWRSCPIGSYY